MDERRVIVAMRLLGGGGLVSAFKTFFGVLAQQFVKVKASGWRHLHQRFIDQRGQALPTGIRDVYRSLQCEAAAKH